MADDVNWELLKQNSEKELVEEPDNIMSDFNLAIAKANLGMIEEAYDYFNELSEKYSKDEFNQAIDPYYIKLEENKEDILLLNYAAFGSTINDNDQGAINYFKRILKITPDNIWIRNFMAASQINLEKYEEAEKVLKSTIKIKNNNYSHLLLALIYYNTGDVVNFMKSVGKSGDLVGRFLFK